TLCKVHGEINVELRDEVTAAKPYKVVVTPRHRRKHGHATKNLVSIVFYVLPQN
ncbi:hypothetical protein Tco_1290562, partial [Tanacetum coccineum]